MYTKSKSYVGLYMYINKHNGKLWAVSTFLKCLLTSEARSSLETDPFFTSVISIFPLASDTLREKQQTQYRHPERDLHIYYHYFISVNWFLAVNSSSVYTCKSPLITLFNFLPSVKSHFCLYLFIYYTPYLLHQGSFPCGNSLILISINVIVRKTIVESSSTGSLLNDRVTCPWPLSLQLLTELLGLYMNDKKS